MRYFSMFSGIGGFEKSLDEENECVGYSEINKYAIAIYTLHYPDHTNYGDANEIDTDTLPDFDLLVGGFPCQAFSIAGKRAGFNDTRGTLFFEIARVLAKKRPRYFVLENVKGLLSHDKGETFQTILGVLADIGYGVQWQILNSKDFGVPQNRERVFIVGHSGDGRRPEVFPIGESDGDVGESSGQSETRVLNAIDSNYYKGADGKRPMLAICDSGMSRTKQIRTDCLPPLRANTGVGHNNLIVTPVLTPDRAEKRQNGRRFKENGDPSFTLTGQDIHGVMITHTNKSGTMTDHDEAMALRAGASHNYQLVNRIRRLTPIECERLQGFPDDWTQFGIDPNDNLVEILDTQRYKCCGNAVTTTVVQAVMERLFKVSS